MKKWIYILCRNKNTAVASPMETITYDGEGRIGQQMRQEFLLAWSEDIVDDCQSTQTYIIVTFSCANRQLSVKG